MESDVFMAKPIQLVALEQMFYGQTNPIGGLRTNVLVLIVSHILINGISN